MTVYAIASLRAYQASPAHLAGYIRGHWAIEARHHIRDTTFGEDGSQVRIGNASHGQPAQPRLGVLRHHGWANIAKALRHNARDAYRPLAILGISPS